jgi:fucose permease
LSIYWWANNCRVSVNKEPLVTNAGRTAKPTTSLLAVVIMAYAIFILLGVPDGMLGVAWPSMQGTFGVALGQMGVLLLATTAGFMVTSFSAGRLITRLGIARLLVISLIARGLSLTAMGLAPSWWALVAAAFCFGVSSGAIDAGMNTHFAMNLSPRLMNWLHASFGLGATLGPLLMTSLLSAGVVWRWGYVILGAAHALMALWVLLRASEWRFQKSEAASPSQAPAAPRSYLATLRRPIVWVNIALFFFYTGTEVGAGNWAFTLLSEGRGVPVAVAGFWTSFYWGSFTFGRFVFGIIADRVNVVNAIRTMIAITIVGTALLWWNPVDWVSFAGLAIIGFALAPVFPLLISSTPGRVGLADATNAIGFQVGAASLGIAVLPGLAGWLAGRTSLEIIPPFLMTSAIIMLALHEVAVRGQSRPA